MDIVEFLEDLGLKTPKEVKFINKITKWAMNASKSLMVLLFTQLMLQIITPYYQQIQDRISDTIDKAKRTAHKLKKLLKMLKQLLKILKAIVKAAIKIIKMIAQLYLNFASPVTWVVWGVTIIVIVLIFFAILFGRFGTFQGEIVIDFDKMREMNQDESEYTDLLNTAALREAFYDSVSDTSFYQTFNLTDLDGGKMDFSAHIMSGVASLVTGQEYTIEDYYASKKCTTSDVPSCVYANGTLTSMLSQTGLYLPQLDNRYQVTDASKNPAKYLIQAESLGTYSDSFGLTSYFRDYWNREENFSLSADFLYELNRWMYETDAYPSTDQIVYPEAFVQPVSFVHDYLRIQTDISSAVFGDPYVYVTQRVTLADIQDPANEFYNKYEYEGLIKSLPSDIVYDYAVVGLNSYEIAKDTASADSVNIGNPSQYATVTKTITYDDGTTETTEELLRLYWVINPYYLDMHMAEEINSASDYADAVKYVKEASSNKDVTTSYYYYQYSSSGSVLTKSRITFTDNEPFKGPYVGLSVDSATGTITFDRLLTSELADENVADHTTTSGSIVYYYCPDKSSTQTTAFAMLEEENTIRPVANVIDYYKTLANLDSGESISLTTGRYVYIDGEVYYTNRIVNLMQGAFETYRSSFTKVRAFVSSENNLYPTKHYQLAQIADEDGNIIASSRNLINKTYLKTKTVRASFRNSDEYWDGFEAFVNADKDKYGYVGGISDFFGATFQGQCVWMEDEEESYEGLYYCDGDDRDSCVADAEKWEEKKCSIISYINQKYPARDIDAKIQNWLYGEDGEMDVPAEALYQILVEYEEYLCDTGTQGVQWEYKYYSNTNSEAERAVAQFREVTNFAGLKFTDYTGIMTYFESDKEKYKDTFDSVVKLNESRAVSTEYTPVAIATSDVYRNEHAVDKTPTDVKLASGTSWGWRLVKNASGSYTIKIAYGESSYEFPDYYSADKIEESVINKQLQDIIDKHTAEGSTVNNVASGLVGMLFNTDYGDVIYGKVNFAYKWVKDSSTGEYDLQYDAAALNDFYMGLFLHSTDLPQLSEYEDVSGDNDQYQDIRNEDQAWNADVIIYRPEATGDGSTATMKSCVTKNKDGSNNMENCGRVTSKTDPDDYYALELKSVRDYGLGSVLSYIEGRKVTFLSGLAITETYDLDGVYKWFKEYYMSVCSLEENTAEYQAQMATMGFYPSELLNDNIKVMVDGAYRPLSYFTHSTGIYESIDDKQASDMDGGSNNGTSLGEEFLPSDLAAIADGLNDLQGTGRSIFEYKKSGTTYWFTVTYSSSANDVNTDTNRGFVLMMKKNPTASGSKWIKTNINVVAPYITENVFFEIFDNMIGIVRLVFTGEEYTDQMARNEATNQFFNPLGYYLAWYDYNTGDVSLGDTIINAITAQGLISKYDNNTAASLREIFNREKTGATTKDDVTLGEVSDIRTKFWASNKILNWFADQFNIGQLFKGAGAYTNDTIWKEFYNTYSGSVDAIDLLDMSRSSKVYLIEEAVTFLGNFVYTYDTELLIVGDLYGNEKIVSDLIFADRYYVINNYIFAVPVYASTIEWTDNQYQSFKIEGYHPAYMDAYEDIIAANNPCAVYADAGEYDETNHPIKSVFNKLVNSLKDTLYVINDALNIVDLDAAGLREWVLRDYCTSNYYYKTNLEYDFEQTYVYVYRTRQTIGKNCENSDTSNGGTQAGVQTACRITDNGVYDITITTYRQATRSYNNVSSTQFGIYYLNGQYDQNGNYVVSTTYEWSDSSTLEYEWVFKYGYATKTGEVDENTMIHIDTYTELVKVYDALVKGGNESTAAKLFIGLQIFDNLDEIAWFNYHENRNDLKSYGYHDATSNTTDRNNINSATQATYDKWCIRTEGSSRCNDASYGDTTAHYAVYNNTYIMTSNDAALVDRIGAAFSSLWGVVSQDDDIYTNLDGRYGFLMGNNRLDQNKNLKANVRNWYRVDKYGVMDSTSMPTSTNFVEINDNSFNLTQNDLILIAQAIYDVFGSDYSNTSYISLGDKSGRANTVELVKRKSGWTWNSSLKGSDQALDAKPAGVKNISVNGNYCLVAYYWLNNNINVGSNLVNNLQISESILKGEDKYDANDFRYAHQIEFQYSLVNDWRLLLVGFEVAQYQSYGTPIALETTIWGNKKQISPVETGSYFNEEVYSSWLNRVSMNEGDTTAKEEYLLSYQSATSTYLYDYLTNFEAYIPLGVMSDSDLVTRGVDAYTSIGSNANRSFSYTATYMSAIKQYLSTPGWQSILENYKSKPADTSFLTSLIPTVQSATVITEDTMTQYIAGLIETTIQYAPTWTIEYHIANNTDGVGAKILREKANYAAISDTLYHSLFASNTSDLVTRTVKLELDDGTYHEFDMLYLGYGALLSYSESNISTNSIAADVSGFGNITLTISSTSDQRLDLEKSLEFVTVKFGKLLYKYGNVSSATMAYFYGEDYWDEMLKVARTEGLSTGPEWHNDDIDLITSVVDKIKDTASAENGFFKIVDYDEDYLTSVFTAEVVDYALTYVTESTARIYLIRNTTSALGSAVSSIGSLADETKAMYETLTTNGGINVVLPNGENTDAGSTLFTLNYHDMDDMARRLNLDLGVLMAVIMSSSDGNPCYGIGVCEVDQDDYVMTTLYESNVDGHKLGLLALGQGSKTYKSNYSDQMIDYKESCTVSDEYPWIKTSYSDADKMCTTTASTSFKVYPTANIGQTEWWNLNELHLEKHAKDEDSDVLSSVLDFFDDDNGMFVDGGREALLYVATELARIYVETGEDALETIFIYFNDQTSLDEVKALAANRGYGSDWYSYYVTVNASNNSNHVIKTLNYYDATMGADNAYTFEENDPAVYVNDNLTGKTIVRTFFDEEYRKTITQTKTYSNCTKTSIGTCTTTTTGSTTTRVQSDVCVASKLQQSHTSNGSNVVISNVKYAEVEKRGTIVFHAMYEDVPSTQCDVIYNQMKSNVSHLTYKSMLFESPCDSAMKRTDTYALKLDMTPYYVETETGFWPWEKEVETNDSDLEFACFLYHHPEFANITANDIKNWAKINYPDFSEDLWNQHEYEMLLVYYMAYGTHLMSSFNAYDSDKKACSVTYSVTKNSDVVSSPPSVIAFQSWISNPNQFDASGKLQYNQPFLTKEGNDQGYKFYLTPQDNAGVIVSQGVISSVTYYPALLFMMTLRDAVIIDTMTEDSLKPVLPDEYLSSSGKYVDISGVKSFGNCSYNYSYKNSVSGVEAKHCVATKPGTSVSFVYDDPDPTKGAYHCNVKTVNKVDYGNDWNLSIDGFSVSAFALYGDTSAYNEYTDDKIAMQNSGVDVYIKDGSNSRDDVDVIITSTLATEDDFTLTATDYSIFAFFSSFDDYTDDSARSWISPFADLIENGRGTDNDYVQNEIWDFPVLAKLRNPLGSSADDITIVERFGYEKDLANGGTKVNEGFTVRADWGNSIYTSLSGRVTATGYNPIYGNYVEVQSNISALGSDIISTVTGERYQITGFKIVYGYLMSAEDGGYVPGVGTWLYEGSLVGKAGNSGRSTGDQIYMAIYVEANLLSDVDDVMLQTGWLPVDPEKYFTTTWSNHKFNVFYD